MSGSQFPPSMIGDVSVVPALVSEYCTLYYRVCSVDEVCWCVIIDTDCSSTTFCRCYCVTCRLGWRSVDREAAPYCRPRNVRSVVLRREPKIVGQPVCPL